MSRRKTGRSRRWACLALAVLVGLAAVSLVACAQSGAELLEGYYTAEASEFDVYGWKEFVIICVRDGRMVTVEYNAKNVSGLVKSWDMDYMRTMNALDNTYPNEYTRSYAEGLLNRQDPAKVDVIAGATHSHHTFQLLAEAAMEQSRAGNEDIAYVDIPEYE